MLPDFGNMQIVVLVDRCPSENNGRDMTLTRCTKRKNDALLFFLQIQLIKVLSIIEGLKNAADSMEYSLVK